MRYSRRYIELNKYVVIVCYIRIETREKEIDILIFIQIIFVIKIFQDLKWIF